MKTTIKMQFDPQIAKDIGVEEAIMYSNIEFWVQHNEANNKNKHDGHYWTYNSMAAFAKLFPFWSNRQIQRILKKLQTKGYIKSANYNNSKYDRTLWYTCIYTNTQMEKQKMQNGKTEKVTPIPDNKPDNKPNNNIISKSQICDPINKLFNIFYEYNPGVSFGNKTQRLALDWLLKENNNDEEKSSNVIRYALSVQGQEYAPTITTPLELKNKFGALKVFAQKIKNTQNNPRTIRI